MSAAGRNVMVIAGESSGDAHASGVIASLKSLSSDIAFWGTAGDRLLEQGVQALYHIRQLNVLGFSEIIRHYPFLRKVLRDLVQTAATRRPVFALLVDYPGMNLRLARILSGMGIPVVYYIAPQVWAWKEGRVQALRAYVSDLISVFPFEVAYFARHGIQAHFFGHPLIDRYPNSILSAGQSSNVPENYQITYLPGSRLQEVRRHLPVVSGIIRQLGVGYKHRILRSASVPGNEYQGIAEQGAELTDDLVEAFRGVHGAVVKSGTSTVEAALFGVPFTILYKTSWFTYRIAKAMAKIDTMGMVNLLAGKKIVQEFIQSEATPGAIALEVKRLTQDPGYRAAMQSGLQSVRQSLGQPGSFERLAMYLTSKYL